MMIQAFVVTPMPYYLVVWLGIWIFSLVLLASLITIVSTIYFIFQLGSEETMEARSQKKYPETTVPQEDPKKGLFYWEGWRAMTFVIKTIFCCF